MVRIGDTIRILYMDGEPRMEGRSGVVRTIDDMGQLWGSWGGLAVLPGVDSFEIVERKED